MDEPLQALTQRFRDVHHEVMACFARLHTADAPVKKIEATMELDALLKLEMELWDQAKEYLRIQLKA